MLHFLTILLLLVPLEAGRATSEHDANLANRIQVDNACAGASCAMHHSTLRVEQKDIHKYGKANSSNTTLKEQRAKILYSVVTHTNPKYEPRVLAQLNTWMKAVPKDQLLIVGREALKGHEDAAVWNPVSDCPKQMDAHHGGKPASHDGSQMSCKKATMIADAREAGADWLMILDDDHYVNPDNVAIELSNYDPSKPLMLGVYGCGHKDCWGMCGGGSEILSRGAIDQLTKNGREALIKKHRDITNTRCEGWSDIGTAQLATLAGVPLMKHLPRVSPWRPHDKDPLSNERLDNEVLDHLLYHYVTPNEMYNVQLLLEKHQELKSEAVAQSLVEIAGTSNTSPSASYEDYVETMNRCKYSQDPLTWNVEDCPGMM